MTRIWLVTVLLTIACGCGVGGLGKALRPDQIDGNTAMEEPARDCRAEKTKPKYAEPLVVDWSSKQRVDLELAMRAGVAVVSYSCEKFELLSDCRVNGDYAFAGVSRKEDFIQLTNSDELKANLPVQGAKLGGALERGASVDLALVRIGKLTTAVRFARLDELEGECEGASHIVRAATVGAFAMTRGSVGKVRAAAELFGASTSTASKSRKQIANRDGDLAACRTAKSSAETAPDQCQAALRLEIVPLGAEGPRQRKKGGKGAKAKPEGISNPCPKGFAYDGTKCTRPGDTKSAVCVEDDAKQCAAQCAKGSAASCVNMAVLYDRGVGVMHDNDKAISLYNKACDLGRAKACERAARHRWRGCKDTKTAQGKTKCEQARARDFKLLLRACDGGSGGGCGRVVIFPENLKASGRSELELMERACALGDGYSCGALGTAYVRGKLSGGEPVAVDVARGVQILQRSCDAGKRNDCRYLAKVYSDGKQMPRNPRKRMVVLDKACALGESRSCTSAGWLRRFGSIGVKPDKDKALAAWQKGCYGPNSDAKACDALGKMLHRSAWAEEDIKKRQAMLRRALQVLTRACTRGGWSCRLAAQLAQRRAAQGLLAACESGSSAACKKLSGSLLRRGCELANIGTCNAMEKSDPEGRREIARDKCKQWGRWSPEHKSCKKYLELGGVIAKDKLPKPKLPKRKRRTKLKPPPR